MSKVTLPTSKCPVCGYNRGRGFDHSRCSKILQKTHPIKESKPKARMHKSQLEYLCKIK